MGVILLALYLGMYAWFRNIRDIVHYQNKGSPEGHLVEARADPWDDVMLGMVPFAVWTKWKVPVLNCVFWPVRTLEEWYWNSCS